MQRFLGEDPIGFNSKDFNFYRYVGNDPINFIDPNGKNTFGDWIRKKLGGEGKEKARKIRFCQECKRGFDNNLTDRQICNIYLPQVIKWCGTDASCRIQYAEFMRDGCQRTCGE